MLRAVSYARVSTGAQAQSGLGTDAQHGAVDREAHARGWRVVARITDDAVSGAIPTSQRPKLAAALAKLTSGKLDVLAVARSDRLARSTIELLQLHERAQAEGWTLAALDTPVDLTGHEGQLYIGIRALFAEFEAAMAGARTSEALEVARSRGVRLGRPSQHADTTKALAAALRVDGRSYGQIAVALTEAGIFTPSGNTEWSRSSVQSLLRTIEHDRQARAHADRNAAEQHRH
ncbi:MAG: resolvase [Acidimicrobiales bacterium]|nr:resolvase [Acidimicrobiales bacterium]MYB80836.1 resolvase [Acidimicrobiales bacterium]MYI11070.1 resolvase [Acidimicrobiales bacterium]